MVEVATFCLPRPSTLIRMKAPRNADTPLGCGGSFLDDQHCHIIGSVPYLLNALDAGLNTQPRIITLTKVFRAQSGPNVGMSCVQWSYNKCSSTILF